MPYEELTGQRPTDFSKWHRKRLPSFCALADGDWWEIRYSKVVAFLETIRVGDAQLMAAGDWFGQDPWLKNWYSKEDPRYPLWPTKKVMLNFLLDLLQKRKPPLPVYIIYHTPAYGTDEMPRISRFKVIEWGTNRSQVLNEAQFIEHEKALWLGKL